MSAIPGLLLPPSSTFCPSSSFLPVMQSRFNAAAQRLSTLQRRASKSSYDESRSRAFALARNSRLLATQRAGDAVFVITGSTTKVSEREAMREEKRSCSSLERRAASVKKSSAAREESECKSECTLLSDRRHRR
ncbi:hypothetical protein RTBOTA2_001937 [Rhodotorula toruloides]|nr:hypothetical protein RTBOTA2_001937 [Rhodotorula toruloides]